MVRKISLFIFSVAILVAGFTGAKKLRYWERSIWIFKTSEQQDGFDRRGGRYYVRPEENRSGIEREQYRPGVFPDSIRTESEPGERPFRQPERNTPDSLRRQFRDRDYERIERGSFELGRMDRDQHGRGGFRGRKKVSLRYVAWFLAVFASFTVIIIYLDKLFYRRKRRV